MKRLNTEMSGKALAAGKKRLGPIEHCFSRKHRRLAPCRSDGCRRSSSKRTLCESRQGASTIEFLTAGVLLATVMTFLVPFVGRVATVNEEIADREWALREVRNLIIEIQSGQADIVLPAEATDRLEDPKLTVIRSELAAGEQQQVSVSIVWTNRFGEEVSPVTLSFWESPQETP